MMIAGIRGSAAVPPGAASSAARNLARPQAPNPEEESAASLPNSCMKALPSFDGLLAVQPVRDQPGRTAPREGSITIRIEPLAAGWGIPRPAGRVAAPHLTAPVSGGLFP